MADDNNNNKGKKKNLKKKKSITSNSVLVRLYNDRALVTKVDNMIDEGQTYDYIIEFCKEKGLDISKSSLTNYKKKREEAIRTGIPLIQLLDKRAKDNVTYITKRGEKDLKAKDENNNSKESSNKNSEAFMENLNRAENVYSDLEFLDEVVSKGMKGLQAFDVVDTPIALKAIDLRAKITNNQLSGLSIAGLREIHMRTQARESALTEVIMKYVPEDKHEELFEDIEKAEKEFYDNLDLTEEDKRASKAIRESGLDI